MRTEIRWGLILAACLCGWTLLLHVTGVYTTRLQYASAADNIAVIFPVFALTGAMLERRRRQLGGLTLREGFVTGLRTMLVSWPVTAAFMLLYHHVIHPEWLTRLSEFELQRLVASGATDAEITAAVVGFGLQAGIGYELGTSLVGTLLFGIVASAVIALVLRRRRAEAVVAGGPP